MSTSTTEKHKRGSGTCLKDAQRLQILDFLEQLLPPSIRQIARQFYVDEKAIRNLIKKKDEVRMRAEQQDQNKQMTTFRGEKAKYPELEERLYHWIDVGVHRQSLPLLAYIILEKAKQLAIQMNIF